MIVLMVSTFFLVAEGAWQRCIGQSCTRSATTTYHVLKMSESMSKGRETDVLVWCLVLCKQNKVQVAC